MAGTAALPANRKISIACAPVLDIENYAVIAGMADLG
jgi:hypothetical protein